MLSETVVRMPSKVSRRTSPRNVEGAGAIRRESSLSRMSDVDEELALAKVFADKKVQRRSVFAIGMRCVVILNLSQRKMFIVPI